jgi:hypothetical protein
VAEEKRPDPLNYMADLEPNCHDIDHRHPRESAPLGVNQFWRPRLSRRPCYQQHLTQSGRVLRGEIMTQPNPYAGPSIFHIGYIKTGTTYLQDELFSKPTFGMTVPGGAMSRPHLVEWFVVGDGYLYDPAAVRAELTDMEQDARAAGLAPVWSHETLIGHSNHRLYHGATVMRKIAALNLSAKVIITVREQRAFAISAYCEFVKNNGTHNLESFIGTGNERKGFTSIMREDFLNFDIAVRCWMDAFGAENVLVLPQELLINDRDAYFKRLSDFLGLERRLDPANVRSNKGAGAAALLTRRWLNRLYVSSPLGLKQSFTEKAVYKITDFVDRLAPRGFNQRLERRLAATVAARYEGRFAESNRRLEDLTGYDLRALGYQ